MKRRSAEPPHRRDRAARAAEGADGRRAGVERRGFSLTELMVAVVVLIAIIFATGKIFGTASKVTSVGEASADVMQELAAIEQRIRRDFERLSREGVFAIQSHAVRNDINSPSGPLLNPNLSPNAFIRSDQLVFFTQGIESLKTARIGAEENQRGQATAARVYYGHAYQLRQGRPVDIDNPPNQAKAHDANQLVTPWWFGTVQMATTRFEPGGSIFLRQAAGEIDGTQPDARKWLLARQSVVLADDDEAPAGDASKTVFLFEPGQLGGFIASKSLFLQEYFTGEQTYQIQNGRVDAAATELGDLRQIITVDPNNPPARRSWTAQRNIIGNQLLYFPRAERYAPSQHRVDQALCNHVIGSACSSFIVEWTYDGGTGAAANADGSFVDAGLEIDLTAEHPWFGLEDVSRQVLNLENYPGVPATIFPDNVDREFVISPQHVLYQAIFGYNQDQPFAHPVSGEPHDRFGLPDEDVGYTPWPSAIRITMVLHDARTVLENGRELQFVVRLPRRGED